MKTPQRKTARIIVLSILLSHWLTMNSTAATDAHNNLTWQGAQTCLVCHETEAVEVHGSGHYQWQGTALYAVNGPDIQGKLNTAFNSYCINILGNWDSCASCHIGLGAKPGQTASATQIQNIDCLICHQSEYKRIRVGGAFVPDTANMGISMDQAVQTVHKPLRSNCLQCHARGGGGDNNKRGDLTLAHATTSDSNFDVHMAISGANLSCQECHITQNHRIAGRGSDLRQTDLDVKMNCSTASCHIDKRTASGHDTGEINRHVDRVACQTCHIKTYARNAADTTAIESTEVYRDWSDPEWAATLNRWEPRIDRGSDLKPEYRFWNGFNWHYSLNDTATLDAAAGTYPTSRLEGDIAQSGSVLYPFKYKKSLQPLADSPGVLVALDTSVYFSSGDYDASVKAGLRNMRLADSTAYRNVETDTWQLITHEVSPKDGVLDCGQCHTATATQMNLKSMGYAMKGTQNTTCTQCHETEKMPSYTSLHDKHVKDKKYDCSWCHTFTRPERGLKLPATVNSVLSVTPTERNVSAEAGKIAFGVFNTGAAMVWSAQVTFGAGWFRIVAGTAGVQSGTISGEFDANIDASSRMATIRVSAPGMAGSPMDITVTQAGYLKQVGADPGLVEEFLPGNQTVSLLVNSTNRHGDKPVYEWLVLAAIYGGETTPLYLISNLGIVDLNQVLSSLYTYTYSFDGDDLTHIGTLTMSGLGLQTGDSLLYGYAYQNTQGVIVLDNIVRVTVQ